MSQYYPQQGPYYPPQQGPEQEYYDDYEYDDDGYYDEELEGDSLTQRLLIFVSGGCLVFICMGCCVLMVMGLFVLDSSGGLFAATPVPGSEIGLTYEEPAFPDESVVSDDNVQLTILDVNRNIAVPGIAPVEGRELVVITIELINLGEEEASFTDSDFILINQFEEAYTIAPAAPSVDGALGRGKLAPGEGLEGRLVFDLIAGEVNMVLGWEGGRDVTPRYIFME